MKAVALLGQNDLRVVDVARPEVDAGSVVLRVKASGICGSDLHMLTHDPFGTGPAKVIDGYRILGHEFSGEIVAVGANAAAAGWQVGERVTSVHNKGGMAEYIHIPAGGLKDLCRIPPHLSYEAAATLEPLCVSLHGFHLREPRDDETVAIFGCGVIGLGYLQAVRAYTRARAIVVDVSPLRLDTARRLGADTTIDARATDPVAEIKRLTGEYPMRYYTRSAAGCDVAVDCAGQPAVFDQALEVLTLSGGALIVAATYVERLPLDGNLLMLKNATLYGYQGFTDPETVEAFQLITNGRAERRALVTHRFALEQAADAFRVQANARESVKVVLVND